jgi:hypothetical protein
MFSFLFYFNVKLRTSSTKVMGEQSLYALLAVDEYIFILFLIEKTL